MQMSQGKSDKGDNGAKPRISRPGFGFDLAFVSLVSQVFLLAVTLLPQNLETWNNHFIMRSWSPCIRNWDKTEWNGLSLVHKLGASIGKSQKLGVSWCWGWSHPSESSFRHMSGIWAGMTRRLELLNGALYVASSCGLASLWCGLLRGYLLDFLHGSSGLQVSVFQCCGGSCVPWCNFHALYLWKQHEPAQIQGKGNSSTTW